MLGREPGIEVADTLLFSYTKQKKLSGYRVFQLDKTEEKNLAG